MSYLKIGSWHTIALVDDLGWHTRCGRLVTTEPTPATSTLPLGEPSCETCLRLGVRDAEPRDVDDDEVPT